ncbi:mannose-1-phosphate guanylyltransferase/mannose-6-phosphate isomerase [Pseudolysobacter antarcticus]|uniref:Xanthan biosynthesis protein XanB n=1 Tax=Pseudolysobacter antarcticus TaxID=2511995 RepID=A0A411HGV8_9GAMM|nr:mannose-1-phosphate guanylyltransferase/mannose-6-phosphate isomerase [Pseudolysobacter antarcticus]QBB69776.1 mannose-1-phosphate guanylyltransferase/mannose-6-phosphate isomerase [Pseudolysobacter antarcticus]
MLIPVILSGGAGTRLWPVSRSAYPKPFMQMGDGQSLLYKTLDRALKITGAGGSVLTVTGRDYYFLTRDEYATHPQAQVDKLPFLLEPVGRNTAPAIVLAAMYAREQLGADATLLVLPADHLIRDLDAFAADAQRANALAQDGWLVTFGIRPTHPETGFGYIRMGAAITAHEGREIGAFVEKPDLEKAETYVASGEYVWNSGMFCFRADVLLETAQQTCPDVYAAAQLCYAQHIGSASPVEFARDAFLAQPDISIDYAIMERAAKRAVVPAQFDWSDIGSWKAMSDIAPESETDDAGNRIRGSAIVIESENCYIQGEKRLVAAVGVKNLVIIDTGDAVLVADRERAQQVKLVVEQLRASGHDAAKHHQTVHRPWGSYTVLEDAPDCKVKRLVVKPGQVLSLQLHHRRSEHWTVVSGVAKVRVGEEEFLLERNESTYIPMNTIHRLENPTDTDIALIEVQCGDYFGEDDIVRLEDRYGRVAG